MRLQTPLQVSTIAFARREVGRADLINTEREPLRTFAPASVAIFQGAVQ